MDNYTEVTNEATETIEMIKEHFKSLITSCIEDDAILSDYINMLDTFILSEVDEEKINVYLEVKNKIESTHFRCLRFNDQATNKFQEVDAAFTKATAVEINDDVLNFISDQFDIVAAFMDEYNDILDEVHATIAFTTEKLKSLDH